MICACDFPIKTCIHSREKTSSEYQSRIKKQKKRNAFLHCVDSTAKIKKRYMSRSRVASQFTLHYPFLSDLSGESGEGKWKGVQLPINCLVVVVVFPHLILVLIFGRELFVVKCIGKCWEIFVSHISPSIFIIKQWKNRHGSRVDIRS